MPQIKKATCCYCGSHTTLRLAGQVRHELSCNKCGAPLSRMKMLPMSSAGATAPAATPTRPQPRPAHYDERRKSGKKPKKAKYRKGLGRKVIEEIWDVVEDIFD